MSCDSNWFFLSSTALALLAPGAALAQGAPASGQAAPAAPQDESDTIVVTAQFRAQNLQDTPLAITAVNAAMLEARSQTDVSQIANQAPSVTLKQQGAAFGPSLAANIRGVGQYDFNPAARACVGLYVDDVYYATLTGSIFDLLDLDRVEILARARRARCRAAIRSAARSSSSPSGRKAPTPAR